MKDDEPVWQDQNKYKAHTIILKNIRNLKEFKIPDQYTLDVVKHNTNGLALYFIKEQTPEIYCAAAKQKRSNVTIC
jgi:hypothetical protein